MFRPVPLNLPPFPAKISKKQDQYYIFDELRKKHLLLTPEEWVRQHWVSHLNKHYQYPMALMKIEGGLSINELQKRSDLVIYNREGSRVLLAEFKAPSVKITEKVFEQIANYNSIYKIPLLLVSNGIEHYYCRINFEQENFTFITELPSFNQEDFGY
ncbi:restriction endonuclease subunit R [Sphingobacterium cellulitidis]|uniref:type I restriction enzyme HsdR N-terminal domain-containing protein n=1 Tax=Sphingobacterium cellulitidis TaxID=1768011 RepID=UPI000B93A83B|nr:type I restriction enzyme HsdR N-terminal domain-containing protein [Sphingobacterium cellulitidis]OYD46207.1 restriction endonuclease subunit R [Sphingobacterium cellulitidis]